MRRRRGLVVGEIRRVGVPGLAVARGVSAPPFGPVSTSSSTSTAMSSSSSILGGRLRRAGLRRARLGGGGGAGRGLRGRGRGVGADAGGQPPQVADNLVVVRGQPERVQVGAERAHQILDLVLDQVGRVVGDPHLSGSVSASANKQYDD